MSRTHLVNRRDQLGEDREVNVQAHSLDPANPQREHPHSFFSQPKPRSTHPRWR
jgi:hypothetical protein